MAHLADRRAFLHHLKPVRSKRWVVYAKAPFAGPEAVLAYLSRYTHRVAISNRRLVRFDESGVTFRYKDYRRDGANRQQVMTLATDEFIRRFLLHVLPRGFHRIRHYGLLAGSARKASLALARELLNVAAPSADDGPEEPDEFRPPMLLLWRPHDRARGVRTMEAAARAAGRDDDEPGDRSMTRHGMVQPSAGGTPPSATDPHASMVTLDADRVASDRPPGRQHRAEAQRSGPAGSIPVPPESGHAIIDISPKRKSP